jgi:periplasmic divalent cation tolerance protein
MPQKSAVPNFIMAYCTVPSTETGKKIGRTLVDTKLAACANLIPNVVSVFRAKGQMHEDPECMMIITTTEEKKAGLMQKIKEMHPYDIPEIIFLPITDGFPPYFQWLTDMMK